MKDKSIVATIQEYLNTQVNRGGGGTSYTQGRGLEKVVPTYLAGFGRVSQLSIQPIATHHHKFSCGVPIGIGEARYQLNHGASGLNAIPEV